MLVNIMESMVGMVLNFNVYVLCDDFEEYDYFLLVFIFFIIMWFVVIFVVDLVGNILVIIVILKNLSM